MKKSILLLLFLISLMAGWSQSTLKVSYSSDGLRNKIKEWKIEVLRAHTNDGKVEKALNSQLGVIGNDYFKELSIGKGCIEQELTRNARYTMDGYKRTIMGKVISNYFRVYRSSDGDDDYHVIVEAMSNDPLFVKNIDRINQETNAATPHNIILGEIDLHQASKANYLIYKNDMPARNVDYACLYGPWIADRGSYGLGNQSSHGTYFEIHPAEQIWWTEKKNNEIVYSLLAANDNSGRFDGDIDFDAASNCLLKWTPQTLESLFAIPFSVKLNDGEKQFNLLCLYDKNVHPTSDNKSQLLKFNGKVLVRFANWSPIKNFTEISFDNVGVDTKKLLENPTDTVITGFIIIKSKIGSYHNTDVGGNLMMIVTESNNLKDKKIIRSTTSQKLKFKVKLDNISCISADDGDAYEDVYGLVGCRVLDPETLPVISNLLPANSKTPVFWSALDGLATKLKKGDKKIINKEFIYETNNSAIITLVADLNEDDNNDDSNPTTSDGIADGLMGWLKDPVKNLNELIVGGDKYKDDKLERYCSICEENIIAGRLTIGSPVKKRFQFASGGTLIEVNFTVERIQ